MCWPGGLTTTWQIQARLGLRYDSTLGYADRIGLWEERCHPFWPQDPSSGERLPVLQIPLAIMDTPLLRHPDPWAEATRLIADVEAAGGVLTLDWHQRVFNPWEPEDYQGMYARLIEECLRRGAWTATLGEVAAWWTGREQQAPPNLSA